MSMETNATTTSPPLRCITHHLLLLALLRRCTGVTKTTAGKVVSESSIKYHPLPPLLLSLPLGYNSMLVLFPPLRITVRHMQPVVMRSSRQLIALLQV